MAGTYSTGLSKEVEVEVCFSVSQILERYSHVPVHTYPHTSTVFTYTDNYVQYYPTQSYFEYSRVLRPQEN